jgi:MFS family permease
VGRRGALWALGALFATSVVVTGARGSLGLFVHPWEEEFGASRGAVSLVTSLGFLAFGLAQPLAGRLLESVEARRVLVAGLAVCAAGYGGGAFATELWQALLLVGIVAGVGTGLASLSSLAYVAAHLVERRRGAIFGLLTAGAAGGQVIVLPIATAALGVSLRASLLVLAASVAATALVLLLAVPGSGLKPAGTGGGRVGVVLREPRFWLLAVPYFVCGYTSTGLTDTHLIPYALDHHSSEAAASAALATLAAFNVVGVLGAGAVTDRVDRGRLLALTYAARGVALVALLFAGSGPELFVVAAFFGLADFATVPPTTSLTRSVFLSAGWALPLGIISGAHQAGSALGAWLGGALYDATGTYAWSFGSAAVALVVASALSWALRGRPGAMRPEPAPAQAT